MGKTIVLKLKPEGRPIRAFPGQFAFLQRSRFGEPHPFTLAYLEDDGAIGFAIKACGDFTQRLFDSIEPGEVVFVEGGYGRFNYASGGDRQLWVAGGIGVTPFLAMAHELDANAPEIYFFHCVRDAKEAIGVETFSAVTTYSPRFHYYLHESRTGRLSLGKLTERLGPTFQTFDFFFCGPQEMRQSLLEEMEAEGCRPRATHFEQFKFR